jgi:hypothetical protein
MRARLLLFALFVRISCMSASAEPVRVRYNEGLVHGFLVLHAPDGALIANGDLLEHANGTRVTSRLVFRFTDGSLYDEETLFSQRGQFRLLRNHLVQKGPSFPRALDMTIDASTGMVRVGYQDGEEWKTAEEHFDLPPDISNGMILTLLKNVRAGLPPKSLAFVVATPKPQLIALKLSSAGPGLLVRGAMQRRSTHYVLKPDIGGIKGLIAPLIGKQPPDAHVWIVHGEAPAFVQSEQQFYMGGPLWRVEQVGPKR